MHAHAGSVGVVVWTLEERNIDRNMAHRYVTSSRSTRVRVRLRGMS